MGVGAVAVSRPPRGDARCPLCHYPHAPGVDCPPKGVWLVALLCRHCNPRSGHYCRAHRDLRPAKPKPLAVVDAHEAQVAARGRYEHDETEED